MELTQAKNEIEKIQRALKPFEKISEVVEAAISAQQNKKELEDIVKSLKLDVEKLKDAANQEQKAINLAKAEAEKIKEDAKAFATLEKAAAKAGADKIKQDAELELNVLRGKIVEANQALKILNEQCKEAQEQKAALEKAVSEIKAKIGAV